MKTCLVCGNQFEPRRGKGVSKYCTMACYRVAQKRGDYIESRVEKISCHTCGKIHVPTNAKKRDGAPVDHHFCSWECYLEHHRKKEVLRCAHCGKEKKVGKWHARNRKYCSHECRVAHKRARPVTCRVCGVRFTALSQRRGGRAAGINTGRTICSPGCRTIWLATDEERKAKISAAFTGENHPNWLGGTSAINDRNRRGRRWNAIAEKVRERDGRVCQDCGMTEEENGRKLDVHHIEPFHNFETARQANRMSNLVALCTDCHRHQENQIETRQILLHLRVE